MEEFEKKKKLGEGEGGSDDYYDKEDDEKMLEDDEMTAAETGFMEGYESKDLIKCCNCKKACDLEKAVEREVDGEAKMFCSEECADEFKEDQDKGEE